MGDWLVLEQNRGQLYLNLRNDSVTECGGDDGKWLEDAKQLGHRGAN